MSDEYHAEIAVIGCLLTDNSTFDEIGDTLSPEDFQIFLHKAAYKAITDMITEGICVDTISLEGRLKTVLMEQQSLFIDLCEIARAPFVVANVKFYAEAVKKKSIAKKLTNAAQEIIAAVHADAENILDTAQQRFASIADLASSDIIHTKDRIRRLITVLDERMQSPGGLIGVSTGFRDLDAITHGLHGGDLVVVAARPSMGKTLLGLNIAEYLAIKSKKTVLVFSMEMAAEQLLERSISSIGFVNANKLKLGTVDEQEHQAVLKALKMLETSNLIIDDRASITVSDIRAKCRRVRRDYDLSLVVVDYIGLMSGEGENETHRIGNISRGLKLLARDLNVPVIAISQLNRGVEQRNNKRPSMADLRQSGAIEQDADLILFIYRDEVYDPQTPNKGIAEIIISKHRNGNIGTIYLTFNGNFCKFEDFNGIYLPAQEKPVTKQWRNFSYD